MDQQSENSLAVIGPHKPEPQTNSTDQPLPLDDQTIDGGAKTITLDLTAFDSRMDSSGYDRAAQSAPGSAARWYRFSPLAASVALATLLGVLAGGAATVTLMPGQPSAPPAVAQSDEARALQERVAKLSGDVAALKSNLETANRNASAQLARIGERLERSEKAQAEPAARLAKIMETLDRLERRTAAAAAPAPDITGSVTSVEKQPSKPPVVDGWRLVDFYAGRAVLENRMGTLFEVGPGSNLPGVGRIESIKRVDGKIVVTTAKGTITSALEPPQRRRASHLPPGY